MQRDFDALTGRRFDLLVVGGGITGLFAAYEAASRGLSVALVEAGDFGSGLTFNHQRTLHGGLRALQTGNVLKARRQIAERRVWATIAPHLVRPLPFLVGTYRFTKRSRTVLRLGFRLYDLVGRRRNAGVSPELHLPRTRLESRAATRALFHGIDETGLSGGAIWYDYQTRHPERLTWCVALAAAGRGAVLTNHVEALSPLRANGRIVGSRVRDGLSGREADVEASLTLLAAGSRLAPLHETWDLRGAPPLLRAVNALVDRPAKDIALAAASRSGRMLTAVPWAGHVLVGTLQSSGTVAPGEVRAPDEVVQELIDEANSAFPALAVGPSDVRLVHHGLTPAVVRGGRADLLAEHRVLRHARNGAPGAISVVGVKYTTAHVAARDAVSAAIGELGKPSGRSRTGTTVLPFAGIADSEGRLIEQSRELDLALDTDVMEHLTSWYGLEGADVVRHAAETGGLGRLAPDAPVLAGEISYAQEHSAAATLADVLLRRTSATAAGHPGPDVVGQAARIMAERGGWSADRVRAEIASVDAMFPVRGRA